MPGFSVLPRRTSVNADASRRLMIESRKHPRKLDAFVLLLAPEEGLGECGSHRALFALVHHQGVDGSRRGLEQERRCWILLVIWVYCQIMKDPETKVRYTARAKVMKALAHPTRLFIVDRLAEGPQCVCELTEMIGADVSTVSRHLSVLREAGIVDDDKRGNQIFYSLRVPCVLNWYACVAGVLEAEAKRKQAVAR